MRIAVIGGGISGLSAGYFLKALGHQVSVFEATGRVGGVVGTDVIPWPPGQGGNSIGQPNSAAENASFILAEHGPNGFLDNEPATKELIASLKLEDQLVFAGQRSKSRFIFIDNQLERVPMSPPALMNSSLLSLGGKLRFVRELLWRKGPNRTDESVFEFADRHFGQEVAERLVSPAILGIFGGDTKDLSVKRAFPRMVASESQHGSLIRGMIRQKGGPSKLFSFRGGQQTLIDALKGALSQEIRLNSTVLSAQRSDRWQLKVASGETISKHENFDYLFFAAGVEAIVKIFDGFLTPELRARLLQYPRSPLVSVSIVTSSPIQFDGFGALVSRRDSLKTLGILHPPSIFDRPAPHGVQQFTLIMGGVFDRELVKKTDSDILELALNDLQRVLKCERPKVESYRVWKHSPGIPQYTVDFGPTLDELAQALDQISCFANVSTILGGVSMNDCIRKARAAAIRLGDRAHLTVN